MDDKKDSNNQDANLIKPTTSNNLDNQPTAVNLGKELNNSVTEQPAEELTAPISDPMPDLANESDSPPTDAPIMNNSQQTSEPIAKPKKAKTKLLPIVLVALVVVVALCVAAYFAFIKESDTSTKAKETSNSSSETQDTTASSASDEVDSAIKEADSISDVSSDDLNDSNLNL